MEYWSTLVWGVCDYRIKVPCYWRVHYDSTTLLGLSLFPHKPFAKKTEIILELSYGSLLRMYSPKYSGIENACLVSLLQGGTSKAAPRCASEVVQW